MRRLVVSYATAVLALLGGNCVSQAQGSYDPSPFVPRVDVSLGYNFIYANSPPGGQTKFHVDGGYGSVSYTFKYWLTLTGEVTGGRAESIGPLGQNLLLMTYAGGPRVMLRGRRISPFGQALFGIAHADNSYFPHPDGGYADSDNSVAFILGGGLDYQLNHRFAIRAEGQYLHTAFLNGVNNSQNQFQGGLGIVFKFRGYYGTPYSYHHKSDLPRPQIEEPTAPATAAPPVVPAGPLVPLPPPLPATGAVPPQPQSAEPSIAAPVASRSLAHPTAGIYLTEIYFDHDSDDLRLDSQVSLQAVAAYLKDHPDEHWRIAGYSDERGTPQYNLSLGEKRANAVRYALVNAGISADRISTVSYGNAVQVCTKPSEPCYRRNRRVEFLPQE